MAVPMVSFAKGVAFGGFQRCVASFRVAGVALCDIPTCVMTRPKWFCVAGAILLPRFQKMRCIFPRRRSTLDTSDVLLRGRPSHETSILRSVRKTRRKTSILKLQSVKFEEVSHEMLIWMLQHVSPQVAGFFGAVAVSLGEAAKPIFVQAFKTGCNVVLRGGRGTL